MHTGKSKPLSKETDNNGRVIFALGDPGHFLLQMQKATKNSNPKYKYRSEINNF
jgi:hypothetical protein